LPIISVVSLVTVESGGYGLLRFLTGRGSLSEFQKTFFRAGHAHAGVLLILSLTYFTYLGRTDYSSRAQWLAGSLLLAGVAAQSGGFFLHLAKGEEGKPSIGTKLTESGALLIAVALLALARGMYKTR
jgi:hypothetical protein